MTSRVHRLLWLVLLPPLIAPAMAQTFTINTGFKAPVSDYYRQVVEEAFRRLGLRADLREIPGERSIRLVNDGVDDGECCRISDINTAYPNLVRVPVPVIVVDFVAFFKGAPPSTDNWNSLRDYEVGVVSGWKILEHGLAAHPPRRLVTLSSPQSLFGMLDKGRIQAATIDRLVGYRQIQALGLADIEVAEPPLATRQLYLFMHKRHAELVPQLQAVLTGMRDDGFLDRTYRLIDNGTRTTPSQGNRP